MYARWGLTVTIVLACVLAHADDRWVIEPTPEAPDAVKAGAADVAHAQKLAKAKQYAEAVAVLEPVARAHPASLHDCNLALAYLRAGALTRARLMWDLSAVRGGARPKWCTGEVATELATALGAAGYVPTTLAVTPPDAVIETGGVAVRGVNTLWLPAGPATVAASSPGLVAQTITVAIAAPSARVAIALAAPKPVEPVDAGVPVLPVDAAPPVVALDAGVPVAAIDAASVAATDAAIDAAPAPADAAGPHLKTLGRRTISGLAALAGGATFIAGVAVAAYARNDANNHYPSDPAFASARDTFHVAEGFAIGGLAVAAVGSALWIYFGITHDDRPLAMPVSGGAVMTWGGAW